MTDTVIDDPMLDDEWLAAPARRSRFRSVLVMALAGALCFLGGTQVQKHFGADEAAQAGAGPAGLGAGQLREGLPEGIGQGQFPGQGQEPGTADDGGQTGADSTIESVIGEVVKIRGNVWIVEDLGGNRHTITVSDDTDVIRETQLKTGRVRVGDPVDITGTSSDEQLQANEVTLR